MWRGVSLKQKIINYSLNQGQMWRLWAKALGEKAHKKDQLADKVAVIRSVIFTTYLITNCFIVAGVIRNWNKQTTLLIEIHEAQPTTPLVNIKPEAFE